MSLCEAVDPAGPAAALEREDDFRALIHAEIRKLPGLSRAVVVLCDLEGLSYLEAAQRLNLPLGTVQSRLARARERLRRALTRQGISGPASFEPGDSHPDSTLGVLTAVVLSHSLARRSYRLCLRVASDPTRLGTIVTGSVQTLIKGGLRSMFFSNMNRALLGLMGGVLFCAAVFHPDAKSGQPGQQGQRPQSRRESRQIEDKSSIDRRVEIPAPRAIKVAAGRGTTLIYALDEKGERIDEGPENRPDTVPPAKEEEREIRWAVVTGIVDHRQLQERIRRERRAALREGRAALPPADRLYRRVDLKRRRLEKDGTWSAWAPIDMEVTLDILDNLPEYDEELTPEEVRVGALVDPLPYLKNSVWSGVDVEKFVPPVWRSRQDRRVVPAKPNPLPPVVGVTGSGGVIGINPPGPRLPEAEPPVLMLRTFDFSVEGGRTYQYCARVVLFNLSRRRGEGRERFGPWSESTEIVTIP
jgi:hypothetical protein